MPDDSLMRSQNDTPPTDVALPTEQDLIGGLKSPISEIGAWPSPVPLATAEPAANPVALPAVDPNSIAVPLATAPLDSVDHQSVRNNVPLDVEDESAEEPVDIHRQMQQLSHKLATMQMQLDNQANHITEEARKLKRVYMVIDGLLIKIANERAGEDLESFIQEAKKLTEWKDMPVPPLDL